MSKQKSFIVTVPQFARIINKIPQYVYTYAKRGKINLDDNGNINFDDPVNSLFIQNWKSQGKTFELENLDKPTPKQKKPKQNANNTKKRASTTNVNTASEKQSSDNNTTDGSGGGGGDIQELTLDAQKKKYEIKRIKAQTRNEEIKAAKNEGKLVPIQEVETLFLYAIEGFHSHYQQEIDSILNTIAGSMDISHERFVEIRKDIKQTLNDMYNETRKELMDGVDNLAEQYSEVRGKGEHK